MFSATETKILFIYISVSYEQKDLAIINQCTNRHNDLIYKILRKHNNGSMGET